MKEIKHVRIDEGTLGYLMSLRFEADGLRVLLHQLIRSGDNVGEAYRRYMVQYKAACAEWNIAVNVTIEALDGKREEGKVYKIDFVTGELVIFGGGHGDV